MGRGRILVSVCVVALCVSGAHAGAEIKLGGQVRPRFEVCGPVGVGHDVVTNVRVRASISADLEREVSAFIQLQDVRLWGEETSTLADFRADNFDLHQGYVTFGDVGETSIGVRIGRQEMSLGGQRLVGAVGWTQQGRSFDGIRVSDKPKGGRVDLFLMRTGDASAAAVSNNAYFGGGYVTVPFNNRKARLDLYALYSRTSGTADTELYTLGARWTGQTGQVSFRSEGSYLVGDIRGGTLPPTCWAVASG